MRKLALMTCAVLLAGAGAAQAQIKAGIAPKPMSQIRAEQAAKAEAEKQEAAEAAQKESKKTLDAPKS